MADPGQFETQDAGAPGSFALGFLKIRGLRSMPGIFRYSVGNDSTAHFSLDELTPRRGTVCDFRAYMYKSQGPRSEFRKDMEFWGLAKGPNPRSRLDPSLLALRPPARWSHEALRGGREICHVYRGPGAGFAAILFYTSAKGPAGECRRLREINRGLTWAPNDWVVRKGYVNVRPHGGATDEPLPPPVRAEVRSAVKRARDSLNLSPRAGAADAVEAIETKITGRRAGKAKLDDLAIDLGCLWGQSVVDALAWEWCRVTDADGKAVFAVASPDRSHYVAPLHYMKRQVRRRNGTGNTTLLLFNLLKARKMPASGPHGYRLLG
jgi:hypothetical protein